MTDTATLQDPAALTRYIKATYHARHRAQLPLLAQMAERVETMHFGDTCVPEGLADLLEKIISEMEAHMTTEGLVLDPAIRTDGTPDPERPLAMMRANHTDLAADIAEIRRLTGGLALPDGVCGTWAALYSGLKTFLAELEAHMHLENDVPFPQAEPREKVVIP
ncbi:MAG: hemerythrin domain-containing protein [Gemmobacter sp.]|nr:hemerythrin domain-containing protein [Gemmobacter sp.]